MAKLTLLQQLDVVPAVIQGLFQTIIVALQYPFLSQAPHTFSRHVLLAAMRKLFTRMSTAQLQVIMGTTESNFIAWAKSQQIPYRSIDIPYKSTKAFQIGGDPHTVDALVLYIHGGGWAMSANVAHFTFVQRLVSYAKETTGKTVAALALQYDLAPEMQYPHQLAQSVEFVRYAVESFGKRPGQIFLGGDSSGGSLILSVFSHLLHPHPAIAPLKLSEPFAGAFLASPVVDFGFSSPRFYTNEIFEPASTYTLRNWIGSYLVDPKDKDKWNEHSRTDAAWWQGLSGVVKELLITEAADEVMADDVRDFVPKIKASYDSLTYFESRQDFHAEPGIGYAVGITEECEAAKYAKSWLVARL